MKGGVIFLRLRRSLGPGRGWALLAAVGVLATACHHHPKVPAQAALAPELGEQAVPPPPTANNDYRICPNDVLEINVFQEPDLKSVLRVSNQGTIDFPLIGVVSVRTLTTREASGAIQDHLARGYLINPQVSVTVLEFSKRRFTVLGEVQRPGSYAMADDQQEVTVLQAIAMAGGYTRIADPGRVTLMRKTDSQSAIYRLNAKKLAAGGGQSAIAVLPGDVITVAESRF